MVIRRSLRNLPGTDALYVQLVMTAVYFGLGGLFLVMAMVNAADAGAQRGHLPWPIAQWALTTPLGVLTVAVGGGLIWVLPWLLLMLVSPFPVHPVDVTELPVSAWPRPRTVWHVPEGATRADAWLGRRQPQRILSLLALSVSALLLIGLLATFFASTWYVVTHFPECSPSSCAPNFSTQLVFAPEFLGLAAMNLSIIVRTAYAERRGGVWFRARKRSEGGVGAYIRRPGVTPEAAAAALQYYSRGPIAPRAIAGIMLALLPMGLLFCGGEVLSNWLSIHWIPA